MCICTSKQKNYNPLERQSKISQQKFTKNELELLNFIFKDLQERSPTPTIAKEDFIRFFPLTGLWGDRMFQKFNLLGTGTINKEEFIIGLGNCATLSQEEQIKYLFDIYDLTNSNTISKEELLMMLYNYPQEDLQEITKDPYFVNVMQKSQFQKKSNDEPSYNATSQFFQSQIQNFMKSRQTYTEFSSQILDNSTQVQKDMTKKISNNKQVSKKDDIGIEDPVLINLFINERTICVQATQKTIKNYNLQQFMKKKINQKPTQHIHLGKGKESDKITKKDINVLQINKQTNSSTKYNNIPIKPSNINNVIKQYCNFVFREFDVDKLNFQQFKTWCLDNQTIFNIFKNTFYHELWGEQDGKMLYKTKNIEMEGYLIQVKKDKTLKKQYYELRENFLIYYTDIGQKPKGIICLEGLIVNFKEKNNIQQQDKILKNKLNGMQSFEVFHSSSHYKKKRFYCSVQERLKWIQNLEDFSNNFYDIYVLKEKIGVGRFSVVYKGQKKIPDNDENKDTELAIKIMKKNELTFEEIQFISYETETMKFLKHPGIINVETTIEDKKNIYIITELVKGGDLFQYIQQNEFLEEVEASILMKQLFATIVYIHDAGIVHRDLKPENIMVVKNAEKDKNGQFTAKQIKIIDFGFSKMVQVGQLIEGYCGSQNYLAPEIIKNEMYGMKVDNFALGCIMYFMLRGSLPFDSWDPEEINQNTIEGKYNLEDDHWQNISSQAKDLIQSLLQINPEDRISTKDALQHEWITNREVLKQFNGKNFKGIWQNKEELNKINQNIN